MLEELREQVMLLDFLLSDPHPGLFTWCDAVRRRLKRISEFYFPFTQDDQREGSSLEERVPKESKSCYALWRDKLLVDNVFDAVKPIGCHPIFKVIGKL